MSDFSGYGFAAGSVHGLRSWRIDRLGRLTGVSYQEVWTPGENAATCKRQTGGDWTSLALSPFQSVWYGTPSRTYTFEVDVPSAKPTKPSTKPEHVPASCSCGFYAYFCEQDNPYHGKSQGDILGIIEGFGETTLGDKGFRAQKARIVALRIREKDDYPTVRRNYPDVPIFTTKTAMLAAFPIDASPFADLTPDTDPDFWTRSAS